MAEEACFALCCGTLSACFAGICQDLAIVRMSSTHLVVWQSEPMRNRTFLPGELLPDATVLLLSIRC